MSHRAFGVLILGLACANAGEAAHARGAARARGASRSRRSQIPSPWPAHEKNARAIALPLTRSARERPRSAPIAARWSLPEPACRAAERV